MTPYVEELEEAEALRLIGQTEVGRIGFTGRFGPMVLPVTYKMINGAVVFRTEEGGALGEDLRTGIRDADYMVAFEIDDIDSASRAGWSVLIQGAAHPVDEEDERAALEKADIKPWVGGERDLFVRITAKHVSGRRVRQG